MPPVRRSRRLGTAARTVVEVVIERPAARPLARSTADRLAAAAATARSWRARVTECADRAYDAERGRIDWKTVATELGLPLIGCLHMFDVSLSTIAVRQLPGPDDWSKDDKRAMAEFVADNLGTLAGDVWRLAGVYMNASEADCLAAYRCLKHSKITAGVREAIQRYREDGMSWGDIYAIFPVYKEAIALRNAFGYAKRNYPSTLGSRNHPPTKWTPAETGRIKEIVRQHYKSSYLIPAINVAVCEFPNKTRAAIKNKAHDIAYHKRLANSAAGPASGPAAAVAVESASGQSGRRVGDWTPGESARLDALAAEYQGALVDWTAIAAALGRTPASCRLKHVAGIHKKCTEPEQEHVGAVNQEAQRQYESGLGVDWAAVSQAVGLSELECLELCRFSEGKDRWTYDPDTFCRDTADRMEAFIAEHYPPPAAPNFNAVSNYMWIDINDCIRMAGMLRGDFEWTDEAKARVARMREQGVSRKEIARQLSPNLTKDRVSHCIRRMKSPRRHAPLTPEEKQRIRSTVDENAGKMSFREVARLVGRLFKSSHAILTAVQNYAASHPLYKARAERADKDQIARDILSGTTTAAEAARRLDVPNRLVTAMVDKFQSRMYSSFWTAQETKQLLEFTRTHEPPYDWRTFSRLLGTKSQHQCRVKLTNLKRRDVVPRQARKPATDSFIPNTPAM